MSYIEAFEKLVFFIRIHDRSHTEEYDPSYIEAFETLVLTPWALLYAMISEIDDMDPLPDDPTWELVQSTHYKKARETLEEMEEAGLLESIINYM